MNTSQPNQENCKRWQAQVDLIKQKLAVYKTEYQKVMEQAQTTGGNQVDFHVCAGLKKEIRTMINQLEEERAPGLKPKLAAQLKKQRRRFFANKDRYPGLNWQDLKGGLLWNIRTLEALLKMEESGGKADILYFKEPENEMPVAIFTDFCKEVPESRRNVVYDISAVIDLERSGQRKKIKAAQNWAMSVRDYDGRLLNEDEYKKLQTLDHFDTETWTWLESHQGTREITGKARRGYFDEDKNQVVINDIDATTHQFMGGFRVAIDVEIPPPEIVEATNEIRKKIKIIIDF